MAPSFEAYDEATSDIPVKAILKQNGVANDTTTLQLEEEEKHDLVLRVFRCLIADLCEQFKGGHPGYGTIISRSPFQKLIKAQRCYGNGGYWSQSVETCDEVLAEQPFLLQ